jgi:hypothetical protein
MTTVAQTATLTGAGTSIRARLGLLVLVLLWAITWALSHGYRGLFHDAALYTLQALARLHPDTLSKDVFLRLGSQDQYTIFSPLYAAVVHELGVDAAAALITLTLQLALFLGAALLLRQVVTTGATLLGLSVFIAFPGIYGSDVIFTCVEPFITPRMGAEALVLGSLAAALCGRARLAAALLVPAILLHPVMAGAGLAALLCLYVAVPRPRLAALLAGGALIALVTAAFVVPLGPLARFDPDWLALVKQRSPYLFLQHWSLEDWSRTAVSLATLAVGVAVLPPNIDGNPSSGRARKLALVTLLTALGGVALTLVACDGLQLILLTQLQPWRWLWLATAVAALLLPAIAIACWKHETAGRCTAALLATAWVVASGPFALAAAAAAGVSFPLLRRWNRPEARLLFYGACGVLAITLAQRIASNLLFMDAFYYDSHIPLWLRKTMSFAHDGCGPFAVMALAVFLTSRPRGTSALLLMGVAALAACVALTPMTWESWSHAQFPPSLTVQFRPWRALIPPGTDVFWSEFPTATWVLLERPSYLSVAQTSGLVFSRPSAMEMQRRARALSALASPQAFLDFSGTGAGIGPPKERLEQACASGELPFLVTGARLSWTPVAEVSAITWHSSGGLRLYRCADRPK